jgi:hypothetical protein
MTAQFPLAHHAIARHRPVRRQGHGTASVAVCWLAAALGLAGSYWLEAIAYQAVSCLFGLLGAMVAVLLTVVGGRR